MSGEKVPSSWKRVPIKDLYLGLYDGPHATPKPSSSGPVFLGIKNITENGRLDLSQVRSISEKEFPKWTKRVLPAVGDIVFSYEATLNRYAVIPEGFRGCLGRRLALIRPDPKKVDHKFLYYYFFGEDWRNTISKNLIFGSTVDRIPLTNFPNFEISVPSKPVQQKIASVLSSYDDLIENNTRRIEILEEMAKLVYDEWFVKFRFPGHENVKMVPSEEGEIPEGWDVKKLDQIASINALSIKNGKNPEEINYIDISSVSTGKIDEIKSIAFTDAPSRARRIVKNGDIIWSTVRPNRKSFCIILNPPINLIVSTGFAVITAKKVPYTYLYHALTTDEFVSYLSNNATGAAYPAVNTNDFKNANILLPSPNILDSCNNTISELFSLKQNLLNKNQNLRRTRDLLLPKLISGEIDVSELDIRAGELQET